MSMLAFILLSARHVVDPRPSTAPFEQNKFKVVLKLENWTHCQECAQIAPYVISVLVQTLVFSSYCHPTSRTNASRAF